MGFKRQNSQASERRRIGGLRAKRMGDIWEGLFESSAWRAGCKVIKIPAGCKVLPQGKLIRVKTPFDFCIVKGGKSVFLDTKTTLGNTWSCGDCDQDQLHWLSQTSAGGCRSGYVVEFRALKLVVFFSVEQLAGLKARMSLKPGDGIQLNSDADRLDLGRLFYERTEETNSRPEPLAPSGEGRPVGNI